MTYSANKNIFASINTILNNFNRIISIDNGNSNILNKSFDKIFIINMESDFVRKKNILILDDYNISYNYVNAITQDNSSIKDFCDKQSQQYKSIDYSTYSNQSICLALSNLLILNYCIHNNIKKILILEDDFLLHKNFKQLLSKNLDNLPNNWNILWLGSKQGDISSSTKYNDNWNLPNNQTWGTHAYGLNNCIREIKEEYSKFNLPIDLSISMKLNNLKKYVCRENIIITECDGKIINSLGHKDTYDLWKWKQQDYIITTKKSINIFESIIQNGSWLKSINNMGSWNTAIQALKNINNKTDTVFFDFIDRDFGWEYHNNTNMLIKNQKWMGVVHHPYILPEYIYGSSKIVIDSTVNKYLHSCKYLITLSKAFKAKLLYNKYVKKNKVNIINMKHPTNIFDSILEFNYDKFIKDELKLFISLGGAFRKLNSIDKININNKQYKKLWMFGSNKTYYSNLQVECQIEKYNMSGNTHISKEVNYNTYNSILSQNIAFNDFIATSANNSILDCIARNTPIIIKKLPAVVEYLGAEYPLYFNELYEVNNLLDNSRIKDAYTYLKNMNKKDLSLFLFIRKIYEIL